MFTKTAIILVSLALSPAVRADFICAEATHVCAHAVIVGKSTEFCEPLMEPKRMCSLINGYRTPEELAERLAYYSECNAAGGVVLVTDTNK